MAKLLLIAFSAADAAASAGLIQRMGHESTILLLADEATDGTASTLLTTGWAEVPPADNIAKGIADLAKGFDYVASVSSMAAKDLLARLAGLLDTPMATDVIDIVDRDTYRRPVAAGAAIETVTLSGSPQLFTFRSAAFASQGTGQLPAATHVDLPISAGSVRTRAAQRSGARPDLSQAKVVVSGGRPLQTAENFEKIIGGLADQLHGALGATRAAVDSGIAANELQVGQTGKIVAPDLYIAAGISGSTQHMAGIKDSKVIVAINKDPGAPIFEFADFGLVADLFVAVPELTEKLRAL